MELCDKSAMDLSKLLRKGKVSSREITESVLKRIEEKEKNLNAYITTVKDSALKQADQADEKYRRGEDLPLLAGIALAV